MISFFFCAASIKLPFGSNNQHRTAPSTLFHTPHFQHGLKEEATLHGCIPTLGKQDPGNVTTHARQADRWNRKSTEIWISGIQKQDSWIFKFNIRSIQKREHRILPALNPIYSLALWQPIRSVSRLLGAQSFWVRNSDVWVSSSIKSLHWEREGDLSASVCSEFCLSSLKQRFLIPVRRPLWVVDPRVQPHSVARNPHQQECQTRSVQKPNTKTTCNSQRGAEGIRNTAERK